MNILEMLGGSQSAAVNQLQQQFGLNEHQIKSALAGLAPALAAGFQRNMADPQGLQSLLNALGRGSHERYVDDPSTLAQEDTVRDGNGILGHVLGSKDVSRQVAGDVSTRTGIGTDVLKKMLPVVAAMMMGAMSKRNNQPAAASAGGGAAGITGMLGSLLDSNRDGSMVDDVVGMVGKYLTRR